VETQNLQNERIVLGAQAMGEAAVQAQRHRVGSLRAKLASSRDVPALRLLDVADALEGLPNPPRIGSGK